MAKKKLTICCFVYFPLQYVILGILLFCKIYAFSGFSQFVILDQIVNYYTSWQKEKLKSTSWQKNSLTKLLVEETTSLSKWHNDTQHNNIQANLTQHKGLICGTQHKWHLALTTFTKIMLLNYAECGRAYKMAPIQNATRHKGRLTNCQLIKSLIWKIDQSPVVKMESWQKSKLIKWQVDKRAIWQKGLAPKSQFATTILSQSEVFFNSKFANSVAIKHSNWSLQILWQWKKRKKERTKNKERKREREEDKRNK